MLHTVLVDAAFSIGGVIVGAIVHARIADKAAATKSEIADWAIKLRFAAAAEEKTAKEKVRAIVAEIEKKL